MLNDAIITNSSIAAAKQRPEAVPSTYMAALGGGTPPSFALALAANSAIPDSYSEPQPKELRAHCGGCPATRCRRG